MAPAGEANGRCASPGRFAGPVHVASATDLVGAGGDDPALEAASLVAAIQGAIDDISGLSEAADRDVSAILDFQIDMLGDPELAEGAFDRIAAGEGAALAWVSALDDYIHGFRFADDDLVRARVADLVDIRDRVLSRLAGKQLPDFPPGTIYCGPDMTPTAFLTHDWSQGGAIVLETGSSASHVAILARARAIPMVVAAGSLGLSDGMQLDVEASEAGVRLSLDGGRNEAAQRMTALIPLTGPNPVRLADGSQLDVSVIINSLSDLSLVDPASVAGIGLLRSEFFIRSVSDLADEERQRQIYQSIIDWAGSRAVTIRLFDLGGDKQVPGLDLGPSARSMLGLRGVRVLLARPEILRIQARALLQVRSRDTLRVLVPMVTLPGELEAVRAIFDEEAGQLVRRGISPARLPIGMMVEVPAAALMIDQFAGADFFSLGTNDLGQYLAAAARDVETSRALLDGSWPALSRMISNVVAMARAAGKPVSLCGDLAGDVGRLHDLVSLGIREVAVAPARLPGLWNGIAVEGNGSRNGA